MLIIIDVLKLPAVLLTDEANIGATLLTNGKMSTAIVKDGNFIFPALKARMLQFFYLFLCNFNWLL
jgi:hypothetical protein